MQMSVIYAIVVVAVAPLIGIWRGNRWAKANGLKLRSEDVSAERQAA